MAAFAYNITRHATAGFTPQLLMTGREMNIPLDLLMPEFENVDPKPMTAHRYVQKLNRAMRYFCRVARVNTKEAQVRQKRNYDKRIRNIERLQVGQCDMGSDYPSIYGAHSLT